MITIVLFKMLNSVSLKKYIYTNIKKNKTKQENKCKGLASFQEYPTQIMFTFKP